MKVFNFKGVIILETSTSRTVCKHYHDDRDEVLTRIKGSYLMISILKEVYPTFSLVSMTVMDNNTKVITGIGPEDLNIHKP